MDEDSDKSYLKMSCFSGKPEDWPVFSEKFCARARRKKFKDVLLGKVKIPTDSEEIDTATAAGKEKMKLRELNNLAYEALVLLIDGDTSTGRVAFNIVRGCKTTDLGDGDAALAWKRLCDKYEPKSAPSRLALKSKFSATVLKNANQDPDIWLTELEDLRVKLISAGSRMSEEELLEHVLNNLPKEYEIVVSKLEDRLGDTTNPLTIEDVRAELNLKYQRLNKGKIRSQLENSGDNNETALFAGGFKGKCHGCGEWGHKRPECPKRNNNGGGDSNGNPNGGSFNGKCHWCKKTGHRKHECRKFKEHKAKKQAEQAHVATGEITGNGELAFMALNDNEKLEHIWIADSGASDYMCDSDEGLEDWVEIHEPITVGGGNTLYATKKGAMRMMVYPADGKDPFPMRFKEVKVVPRLGCNLFSLTKAMNSGFQLGNEGKTITLTKDNTKFRFDRTIQTKNGWVCGIKLVPIKETRIIVPRLVKGSRVNAMVLHNVLGHPNNETTRATADYYGLRLIGDLQPCDDCLLAKARQKNIGAATEGPKSTTPGERLGFDISSIKDESLGGNKFWLLIVDEATDFPWSFFLKSKSDTAQRILELVQELKIKHKIIVRFLRCDNAGENKKAEELLKQKGFGIQFEYTSPRTPQQNGKVERKFATLYGKIRATLNALKLPESTRTSLWAEAAQTETLEDGLIVKRRGEKPSYTRFFGKDSPLVPYLRMFGEMAVLALRDKIVGKGHNKGVEAMFVGYSKDHPVDCYRFLVLATNSIQESRDVQFLNMSYPQWIRKGGGEMIHWAEESQPEMLNQMMDNGNSQNTQAANVAPPAISPEPTPAPHIVSPPPHNRSGREPSGNMAVSTQNEPQRRTASSNAHLIRELSRLGTPGQEPSGNVAVPLQNAPQRQPASSNARLIRELSRLGTFYNKEAEMTMEAAKAQAEPQEEEMTDAPDETGNLALTLFGREVGFIAKSALQELVPETKPKICNLDKLMDDLDNTLADDTMPIDVKNEKLREIVGCLKEYTPNTFQEAYNHDNEKFRNRFREAIRKEFRDMTTRGVWRNIKRRDVPPGRRTIKCKWVFEIKRSGRFRARLVACGYSQVPGVDFQNSYAPTINDVSWRILIIAMLLWNLEAKIVDVETAFLMGELEEDIYMDAPEGSGLEKDDCVKLNKSMYGLVQGARQYYKFFVKKLQKIGFKGGVADPCLMVRRNENGVCYIAIWVDDSLLVGDGKAIDATIKDLEAEGFKLKVESDLTDYLSCEIKLDRKRKRGWIHQPHLLKKLRDRFGKLVAGMPSYTTPGSPHHVIVRDVDPKVDAGEQSMYRSGVGMLLYLVKHSRPDIANAVRELTKVLDGASPAAFKEMKRVIKYVLDTENLALKIEPDVGEKEFVWKIVMYSDSDYATDPETRLSVSGFVLYLCGVAISWRSKQQRSVTLSSSEAEFVALSEAVKEIRFVYQLLMEIGIQVELPIIVRVDNIGAIFMSENIQVSQRTKHVDIRLRFINQYVDDGFIKIIFVGTNENHADLFTKNLSSDPHERHASKMVNPKTD